MLNSEQFKKLRELYLGAGEDDELFPIFIFSLEDPENLATTCMLPQLVGPHESKKIVFQGSRLQFYMHLSRDGIDKDFRVGRLKRNGNFMMPFTQLKHTGVFKENEVDILRAVETAEGITKRAIERKAHKK